MRKKAILAAIVTALGLAAAASAQSNVLVNGDFETNPPPNFGNNINYSIAPWILGAGQQSNVVKVDGPGGFDYGDNGPESDASAPGPGKPQHYLDIANGGNDFYQRFTPQCSGEVFFGGYFSTRIDSSGTATIKLVEGTSPSGTNVIESIDTTLPGGNSRLDPWTRVQGSAHINALQTYTFDVRMDNNLNFDNGFVRYELTCNPPDPCCPPWNSDRLEDMLFYQGSGSISAPYTLRFTPSSTFESQIQAYIDYLHAVNPAINTITIAFRLNNAGTGATPTGGTQVGSLYFISWSAGGGGTPSGSTTFNLGPMLVNRWYRVNTGIFLNDRLSFFPASCADNKIDVRIQVQRAAARGASPVLQIRMPDGSVLERPLS